jgi:hypothetical protein
MASSVSCHLSVVYRYCANRRRGRRWNVLVLPGGEELDRSCIAYGEPNIHVAFELDSDQGHSAKELKNESLSRDLI